MEGDTFLLAILKTLTSTFHLIFSDFMFILWWGVWAGDSGDSHPGLYFQFRENKHCDICDQ